MAKLVERCVAKRPFTGPNEKISLDPIRKDFRDFIGNVCLGKLVNPLVPRDSGKKTNNNCYFSYIMFFLGKSSQDYGQRITIVAEQIRKLYFGSPEETTFYYEGYDKAIVEITLPTLEGFMN
jgi:hypothetical protein